MEKQIPRIPENHRAFVQRASRDLPLLTEEEREAHYQTIVELWPETEEADHAADCLMHLRAAARSQTRLLLKINA